MGTRVEFFDNQRCSTIDLRRFEPDGRFSVLWSGSLTDAVRLCHQLQEVCNVASITDNAVLDDPEADLPTVVRLSDGSARVDLEFGDDGRLDRRLSELGRE
jgi:hypothetical protein